MNTSNIDTKPITGFRQRFICNCCNTEFLEEPTSCRVCDFVAISKTQIINMATLKEYSTIKHDISHNLEDSIPKFDLYNMINSKRAELGF